MRPEDGYVVTCNSGFVWLYRLMFGTNCGRRGLMKKFLKYVLLVMAALLCFLPVEAKAETYGDYEYEVDKKTGEATISRYKGNSESVIIPEEIDGYKVTGIGDYALNGCEEIKSLGIPYGVKDLGVGAFQGCKGIKNIEIPNSVIRIGSCAFRECELLTDIYIPSSVTNIEGAVFMECAGLNTITVSDENPVYDSRNNCNAIIETAGNRFIQGCNNTLIPDGVTSIGSNAFQGCKGLKSIVIPSSVTNMGDWLFNECDELVGIKVDEENPVYDSRDDCNAIIKSEYNCIIQGCKSTTIPNSVTGIGYGAFTDCIGLRSVIIPRNITSIGEMAFAGCINISSMIVEDGNTVYDSRNDCNAIIETKTNTLISGCKNTKIPGSITSIGVNAFLRCAGLKSITIPDSVITIDEVAFQSCTGLTSITIPNSVTSIGLLSFSYCTGLTSITIPRNLTSIGRFSFWLCTGLSSIKVDENNPVYESCDNCNAIIEKKTQQLIAGCKNTKIPTRVISIDNNVFQMITGLVKITIPDSVTSIGEEAFSECTDLTSITIPSSVTSIGNSAFKMCDKLTIYCTKGSYAEQYAKENNLSYKYGTADDQTITTIDISKSSSKITVSGIVNMTYTGKTLNQSKLVVRANGKTMKAGTDYAVTYKNNRKIGTATIVIKGRGKYTGTITKTFKISITKGAKYTIGKSTYTVTKSGTNGKGTVTLTGVTYKRTYRKFTSYRMADTVTICGVKYRVTSVGAGAFKGYSSLKMVTVGKYVTTIGTRAFYGCSKLGTVKISSSGIAKVSKQAFAKTASKPVVKATKSKLVKYKRLLIAGGISKKAVYKKI